MIFDGKIGMHPFVSSELAKRKSLNRPRDTMVTKAMTSLTRDVVRRFVIDKLLPNIKSKWPLEDQHNTIGYNKTIVEHTLPLMILSL
jgi:hypothetical protein